MAQAGEFGLFAAAATACVLGAPGMRVATTEGLMRRVETSRYAMEAGEGGRRMGDGQQRAVQAGRGGTWSMRGPSQRREHLRLDGARSTPSSAARAAVWNTVFTLTSLSAEHSI